MPRASLILVFLAAPLAAQVVVPRNPTPVISPVIPTVPDVSELISNLNIDLSGLRGNLDLELAGLRDNLNFELSDLNSRLALHDLDLQGLSRNLAGFSYDVGNPFLSSGSAMPPAPWAKADPADSLYRAARESLNHGDYRKAAAQFDDIPKKFPKSEYVKDAPYWRAFALYRIGGTPELTEALAVLDKWRTDNPPPVANAASRKDKSTVTYTSRNGFDVGMDLARRGDGPDVDGLSARIAGVLASRGMADNAAVKKALAASGNVCDSEDQSVKAEALSAVMQSSPEQGRAIAAKILARKDECSVPLRRNALLVLARKHDASTVSAIAATAKNDPSASLRSDAIDMLSNESADEAVAALDDLSKSTDAKVQRDAIRALGNNTNPRARTIVHNIVERADVAEPVRISALSGFGKSNTSADDATWLRSLYSKSTLKVQERIVSILTKVGGDVNQQWLLALARNESEPASVRATILDQMGRTMDIATLSKFFDTATNRSMRESVISILGSRNEPEAVDKLIQIVKTGTDPNIRRAAIGVLARSKDPRAVKLLLDLVDK